MLATRYIKSGEAPRIDEVLSSVPTEITAFELVGWRCVRVERTTPPYP
jgi:hypothetical protein